MLVLSLMTQLQEVAAPGHKRLTGNVRSFEELLEPENLAALEAAHTGPFAFLAFHPAADVPVTAYVRSGTLGSDSGPHLLTLFTLDADARWPRPVSETSFGAWLDLDTSIHPAYELTRMLFPSTVAPPLPGISFFAGFTVETEAVYVSLSGLTDEVEVRERLRSYFGFAERAFRDAGDRGRRAFADRIAVALRKEGAPYTRSGRTSMREWLVQAFRFVSEHKGDIVTTVGLFT